MKARTPLGPEYESPEFQKSAAYADYTAALASVGCQTYPLLLDAPRAARDQFHATWTARMQARCGIAPNHTPPAPHQRTARVLPTKSHRTRLRVLATLPAAPEGAVRQHTLAVQLGISPSEVRRNLRELEAMGAVQMRESQREGPGRGQRLTHLYYRVA